MSRRRSLIAAALAVVYPGVGHLYLRKWLRALAWFGLSVLSVLVMVPPEVLVTAGSGGVAGVVEAAGDLPASVQTTLLLLRVMNVIDAAWLGLRSDAPGDGAEGPSCPNCGKDLDADLDFCHWCTTPLDSVTEESRADGGLL